MVQVNKKRIIIINIIIIIIIIIQQLLVIYVYSHQILVEYLIVIDALAACEEKRLCSTIQIADTGIVPGSGIGNSRTAFNRGAHGMLGLGVEAHASRVNQLRLVTDFSSGLTITRAIRPPPPAVNVTLSMDRTAVSPACK